MVLYLLVSMVICGFQFTFPEGNGWLEMDVVFYGFVQKLCTPKIGGFLLIKVIVGWLVPQFLENPDGGFSK